MYMRSGLAVQKTNELRFLSSRCIFEVWRGTARWKGRERGCRRSRCTPETHVVDDDCEDKDDKIILRMKKKITVMDT